MNRGFFASAIPANLLSMVRFGLVGLATAVVNFSIFWLMHERLNANSVVAVSFSFVLAAVFQFVLNQTFTFHGVFRVANALKFSALLAINYVVSVFVVYISTTCFLISPYISIIISLCVTTPLGYVVSRFWVYMRPIGSPRV